jgi:hypothetical protein
MITNKENTMNNPAQFGTEVNAKGGPVNAVDLIHHDGACEMDVMQVYDGIFDMLAPFLNQSLTAWITDPSALAVEIDDRNGAEPPLSFNVELEMPRANGDYYTRRYDFSAILLEGIADGDYGSGHVARIIAGARELADKLQALLDDPDKQW